MSGREIAREVAIVPGLIANAYLVGSRESWVVVDAGIPGSHRRIRRAATRRFGADARPRAVVLTHGHFDHAGSAGALASYWGVRIFAHERELPFLNGEREYPPMDSSPPGFFCKLSRLFPSRTVRLDGYLEELRPQAPPPGLEEWECVETPGHTPGHVAFFRPAGGVLLAGDAITTMDLDSFIGTILCRPRVCRPPVPATTDWDNARRSVERLAALRPRVLAAGHGPPIQDGAAELQSLAAHFAPPPYGRYVQAR